jgi:hypothetical protein
MNSSLNRISQSLPGAVTTTYKRWKGKIREAIAKPESNRQQHNSEKVTQ